jgi:hypothetical protein
MATEANLELFADYVQIYLADPLVEDDWSDAWHAPSALSDRFIVCPRILVSAQNAIRPSHFT